MLILPSCWAALASTELSVLQRLDKLAAGPACAALGHATPGSVLQRTYTAPRYWPFPAFRIVLETKPGLCDLAAPEADADKPRHCAAFERGELMMPESFVVHAIASFLGHCPSSARPCRAVDLGGNLGIHTAFMAALGSHVTVIEPSRGMVSAIRDTVAANCWEGRVDIQHAGVTANESADGSSMRFGGGWRLADRGARRRQSETVALRALQPLLRGGVVDFLKVDIDNSEVEQQLIVALVAQLAKGEADVRALIIEISTSRAVGGKAQPLAAALAQLQRTHGYSAYRLAHHLHTMRDVNARFYSPCIGARAFKYALYVKPLDTAGWLELLRADDDRKLGRADTVSLVLSKDAIGRGAEAQWHSESMEEAKMPRLFRQATCGAGEK